MPQRCHLCRPLTPGQRWSVGRRLCPGPAAPDAGRGAPLRRHGSRLSSPPASPPGSHCPRFADLARHGYCSRSSPASPPAARRNSHHTAGSHNTRRRESASSHGAPGAAGTERAALQWGGLPPPRWAKQKAPLVRPPLGCPLCPRPTGGREPKPRSGERRPGDRMPGAGDGQSGEAICGSEAEAHEPCTERPGGRMPGAGAHQRCAERPGARGARLEAAGEGPRRQAGGGRRPPEPPGVGKARTGAAAHSDVCGSHPGERRKSRCGHRTGAERPWGHGAPEPWPTQKGTLASAT